MRFLLHKLSKHSAVQGSKHLVYFLGKLGPEYLVILSRKTRDKMGGCQ